MSTLKTIVFWVVSLQLFLVVVNNIEIIPGVYLDTGETLSTLNAGGITYDPITGVTSFLFNTFTSLQTVISSITGTSFDFFTIVAQLANALVNLLLFVLSILVLIAFLLYQTTFGSIAFYTYLFSLIDPVFGSVLGIALGSIQTIAVIWGLTEFIPTTPNKEA
jgi:hypothetical protein